MSCCVRCHWSTTASKILPSTCWKLYRTVVERKIIPFHVEGGRSPHIFAFGHYNSAILAKRTPSRTPSSLAWVFKIRVWGWLKIEPEIGSVPNQRSPNLWQELLLRLPLGATHGFETTLTSGGLLRSDSTWSRLLAEHAGGYEKPRARRAGWALGERIYHRQVIHHH